MKRILFVNDEMVTGGVARILNTLLKNLDQNKYQIDLLVLHHHGQMLDEIPDGINVIKGSDFFGTVDRPLKEIIKSANFKELINKLRLIYYMKSGKIFSKIQKEREKILSHKYDVEFSAKEGFCTIFVSSGDSTRKLNWVQVDYEISNYSANHMSIVKKALANIDLNIACSNKVKRAYENVFGVNNVVVIHNLMDIERIKSLSENKVDYPFDNGIKLIAVARFHPQKSLDRLLYALKFVIDNDYNCNLVLIGGGELENELKSLVGQLNLEKHVEFLGYKSNPYSYIRQSDLFVLSSLYEGYPTIVLESFISGTPVLATNCAGVDEQITESYEGLIVDNNQAALNDGLLFLISSNNLNNMKIQLASYKAENEEILEMLGKCFNEE